MADVNDAVDFLRRAQDAESDNRQQAINDLNFRYGDQWPTYAAQSRGLERPQLTINEMDSYIRQVTNSQRQQRPRIKVHPVDDNADPKIAKVITGLIRHIEVNSDADNAYDTAFDFSASMGWGYWRVRTDYIEEKSFNQDIFIDVVDNPFCVYFDPNSRLPDGSDAEEALITDLMKKEDFRKQYPDAAEASFQNVGTGDSSPDWMTDQDIRIAEYYCVDRKKAKLLMLTDGTMMWEDELPRFKGMMAQLGIGVKGERDSFKRIVKWRKQTAYDILEEKDLPGKWIPIIPTYWTNVWLDNKNLKQGLVRPGMDSQRMVNFWQTSITESIALAPKAKWLLAEGQDEGHEGEWANANLITKASLRYKQTDVNNQPAPVPSRIQPEQPPAGAIEAAMMANQNLQRVMGIFDPAVRAQEPKSGKAITAERSQSENSNYHGYDNLTRSMKHTGRIILSYIPVVYDVQRVQRIIGEDGSADLVTLNEKSQGQGPSGQAIDKVLNDVTVGTYDIVMDTGPGYDTKRIEGVDAMMQLMNTPIGEKVANVGDDLLVRQMDFPGSDVLADRLAAANPLSQIDEKSDVPPQAQMQIKSLQQQLQQAGQQIQGLESEIKYRTNIEQMKQDGENKRSLMTNTTKAHDTETRSANTQHDVETKAITSQNVAEINGIVQLLVKHIDTKDLEREIEARNAEQVIKNQEEVDASQVT